MGCASLQLYRFSPWLPVLRWSPQGVVCQKQNGFTRLAPGHSSGRFRHVASWHSWCLALFIAVVCTASYCRADEFKATTMAYRTAGTVVANEWHSSMHPGVLCKSAAVHGFVTKEADPKLMPSESPRCKFFRHAGLPIYMRSMVYVSRKYRAIYIRQPKSASSTIMKSILRTLCDGKSPCDTDAFVKMWVERITYRQWMDYFVFTVVRNPWTRAASAFTFMHEGFLFKKNELHIGNNDPTEKCSIPFLEFTMNSYSLEAACMKQDCCAYITNTREWAPGFISLHIGDQAHSVFAANGKSMVDYIGRSEHMLEDWAEIIAHINTRENTTFPTDAAAVLNKQNRGVDDSNCLGDSYARMYNTTTAGNVARHYAVDVMRFGFLQPAPPLEHS